MIILYTSGYNSVKKFTPIARIFFITPLKRLAPPFWFYMYGTKGSILIPYYSKYSIICNFCVIILLLYLSTVENTLY